MNPLGSANKFLAEAIEEYGLDDYITACETEAQFESEFGIDLDDEFGFDFGDIVKGVQGIVEFGEKHGDKIQAGMKLVQQGSDIANSMNTTQKGRKRASRGRQRQISASSSPSISPQQRRNEIIKGKIEQIQGHLQMSLGEMRRQMGVTGVQDSDVQLEVIRNAFAKQYFAMDPSKRLEKVLLKKTIIKMDQQLMQAFHRRNQQRASQGLKPFVASYQQPTLEYKV